MVQLRSSLQVGEMAFTSPQAEHISVIRRCLYGACMVEDSIAAVKLAARAYITQEALYVCRTCPVTTARAESAHGCSCIWQHEVQIITLSVSYGL